MRDPLQASDAIDRYFTAQVVGRHMVVDMGLSATARNQPVQGVVVEWASGRARVSRMAWRSLWVSNPVDAVSGQPVYLPQLVRWKRRVLLLALLVWSLALAGGMVLWRH